MTEVASPPVDGGSQGSLTEARPRQDGPEIFRIADCQFSLISDPAVFRPTLTTSLLTERVLADEAVRGEVLDLGCGLGPIAIVLAKRGATHVWAVDLMPRACELAKVNAQINGEQDRITVLEGDLFDPVANRKFDLIVDDVSGVAAEVAKVSRWFPEEVPLGGEDGAALTVRMLNEVKRFLSPGGSLYFPVLGLSNRERIVASAEEVFGDGLYLVASKQIPFSPELKSNLSVLLNLRERGIIGFSQIRSRCFWTLEIYRGTQLV